MFGDVGLVLGSDSGLCFGVSHVLLDLIRPVKIFHLTFIGPVCTYP